MNILILDGTPKDNLISGSVVGIFNSLGNQTDAVVLRDKKIAPCLGCFDCWIKTPGICRTDDYGREVTKKTVQCDLMVYLTPVTFGGYSSQLKKALDRSIGMASPFFTKIAGETHHKKRYKKYPDFVVIGIIEKPDTEAEEIFEQLAARNALNNHCRWYGVRLFSSNDNEGKILDGIKSLIADRKSKRAE